MTDRSWTADDLARLTDGSSASEEDQKNVMQTLEEKARAMVQVPPTKEELEQHASCEEISRLRVRQDTADSAEGGFVVQPDAAAAAEAPLDAASMDMTPAVLPATERRGKNEVDVAACGIPLEVRRFQCTKSTLALKEATKNDATLLSTKLVDYIVSLTFGHNGICSEKDMCEWLVAQLCDRIETGQVWVIAKTYSILSALLWRGSISVAYVMHDSGRSMFQVSHIVSLLQETVQDNLLGEQLPCSLQPIKMAAAGRKSACGKAVPQSGCVLGMLSQKVCGAHATAVAAADGAGRVARPSTMEDIPPAHIGFLIASVAYLESLCEYRVRHPTLDLARGEILTGSYTEHMGTGSNDEMRKAFSPTAWKELLDDTLELMKAIAVTDPHTPRCPIGNSSVHVRLRDAMLLYQIACRALVRLLHAVLSVSHTFVASLQAGLMLPSSNLGSPKEVRPSKPSGSSLNYLGMSFDPTVLDYSITPDVLHDFSSTYYNAIFQFNRTVKMLRGYYAAVDTLDKCTVAKVTAALKVLPEECIAEFKATRAMFEHPVCSRTFNSLYSAAKRSAAMLAGASDPSMSEVDGSSPASSKGPASIGSATSPMTEEEVRKSMMAMVEFHSRNKEMKQQLWKHQVEALCGLFDAKEAAMLQTIFGAGLRGLDEQWKEFANNGAAAAEKALMDSAEMSSHSYVRDSSLMPGLSSSELSSSVDRSNGRHNSDVDKLTRSSTYIIRSLPQGVRVPAELSSGKRTDLISLSRAAADSITDSSIDALLQEDDVVVICNEECSCNDSLKLVDRFQVLMDVPLGEGSYGKVYRAWDEMIGCYLAAKELPLDASKSHKVAVREVLQEYTVLTELSHPNIVRVVAFMVLKQTARIYMEWMPSGSLQDVLHHHPRGVLRESVVRRYARDVLSGLAFLHSRGVIHRDVKPGNMLLSSEGAVKLTDFGTSLVLSGNNHTLESDAITGTVAYMAPESVQGTYSSASDIWSFGCSILHLVTGNVPWYNPSTQSSPEPIALLFKIGSLNDATHLERPHDALKAAAMARKAEDSVTRSLSPAPSDVSEDHVTTPSPAPVSGASSASDSLSAALLDVLDTIFVVDRKKRPSANDLLHHPYFAKM